MDEKRIELGGLWANTKKDGEVYYSGKATSGTTFLLFKNKSKEPGDNRPTYILCLSESKAWEPESGQKEFAGSDGKEPF